MKSLQTKLESSDFRVRITGLEDLVRLVDKDPSAMSSMVRGVSADPSGEFSASLPAHVHVHACGTAVLVPSIILAPCVAC